MNKTQEQINAEIEAAFGFAPETAEEKAAREARLATAIEKAHRDAAESKDPNGI
jgi:hypothetical protein